MDFHELGLEVMELVVGGLSTCDGLDGGLLVFGKRCEPLWPVLRKDMASGSLVGETFLHHSSDVLLRSCCLANEPPLSPSSVESRYVVTNVRRRRVQERVKQ